jgi:hypothetical protein
MRPGLSAAWLLLTVSLVCCVARAEAGTPEIEAGFESLFFRTTETALNRDNVLQLGRDQELLRATLAAKQSLGPARAVFRGFVERRLGGAREETRWRVRQAYAQYAWGSGIALRAGKQRIAWGSGFAWNPTNRVEPPKNPLNTGLEQEGAWAARLDWTPAAWVGVILVAARGETTPGDLPFAVTAERRRTAAVRARFLVRDTDLALVFSGGKNQRTLVGFDIGRDVAGLVSFHAEGAFYRGADLEPRRNAEKFFRLATGLLYNHSNDALALEYFFNGEGYDEARLDAYLAGLDATYARAVDQRLSAAARAAALAGYFAGASVPYSGGLGLRRHYLQASWTRAGSGKWTLAARGVAGLADGGFALTPGVVYAPRGNVTLHVDAVLLVGPAQSEYRLAPIRGAVQGRVKVMF